VKRLLSISHSYVVALNRALPNAIAQHGWDVTVAAPGSFHGDLGPIALEAAQDRSPEPVRLVAVPMRHSRYPHAMRWGRELRALLADRWDVVHVWEEPYVLAGAQVARWHKTGALVFSTFQNIAKRYPPPLGWFERYAMRRASAWIAFGKTIESALEDRPGYAALPRRVIPPGVDLSWFHEDPSDRLAVRAELGVGPNELLVGYAGRFVASKGLSTLTAALDSVDVAWRALFVGGGPLERELRRWGGRHGDRVRVLTGVRHARVARMLRAMDVLALPSRTTRRWREQFGRVLVEAMACGVPVAGSDSGEIPYVIGDAGLVLPEGDVPRWAEAFASLGRDAALRDRLKVTGRARAQQFSVATAARAHAEFFEELVAR
jgi:glycosyltransferase involved in cell wall biosynthesis